MRRFSQVIYELVRSLRMARQYCSLVMEEWQGHFGGAVQSILPRVVSDYFTISLKGVL